LRYLQVEREEVLKGKGLKSYEISEEIRNKSANTPSKDENCLKMKIDKTYYKGHVIRMGGTLEEKHPLRIQIRLEKKGQELQGET